MSVSCFTGQLKSTASTGLASRVSKVRHLLRIHSPARGPLTRAPWICYNKVVDSPREGPMENVLLKCPLKPEVDSEHQSLVTG